MCARFTLKSSSDVVGGLFELDELPEFEPRYNIAPTNDILAVYAPTGEREATWFRWGLIPSWAKESAIGQKMINARSETVDEKPSFRAAFKSRRCLIPVDSFFEWTDPDEDTEAYVEQGSLFGEAPRKTAAGKLPRQPWAIRMKDQQPFAFAGLWEVNQLTELGPIETATILTTETNELLEFMHDRMPVILPREHWDIWLDPEFHNKEALKSLLLPYPSELMEMYRSRLPVNSPRARGPELILPLSA